MLNHVVHLPDRDIVVTAPASTILLPAQQPSYETTNPIDLSAFGGTVKAPLGYIVHARAGDKGSNCNIGLFVRNEDEWDWLRSFLTTGKLRTLMAQDFKGQKIDRMEFPKLWAVHFLIVGAPCLFLTFASTLQQLPYIIFTVAMLKTDLPCVQ